MGVYICVGMLAAFGLWCVLWTVLGWLHLPREPEMICICKTGPQLEATLRRWNRLRGWNLVTGRLLVVDEGLTEQERMDILRLGREIEFCDPKALPALLEMGAEKH